MNGFKHHTIGESIEKKTEPNYYWIGLLLLISMIMGYFLVTIINKIEGIYVTPEPTFESVQLTGYIEDGKGTTVLTGGSASGNTELISKPNGGVEKRDDLKGTVNTGPDKSKKTKTSGAGQTSQGPAMTEVEKGQVLSLVGAEVGIDPNYFRVVGYSENLSNPSARGDGGCSLGAYQFNMCAGNGSRKEQVWFGEKFPDCSTDLMCATKVLAVKMRTVYNCTFTDGQIDDYRCLYKHQGVSPDAKYKATIDKNYSLLFSKS